MSSYFRGHVFQSRGELRDEDVRFSDWAWGKDTEAAPAYLYPSPTSAVGRIRGYSVGAHYVDSDVPSYGVST
jgi:hypothetical protein